MNYHSKQTVIHCVLMECVMTNMLLNRSVNVIMVGLELTAVRKQIKFLFRKCLHTNHVCRCAKSNNLYVVASKLML